MMRKKLKSRGLLIPALFLILLGLCSCGDDPAPVEKVKGPPKPKSLKYEVVETMPHDTTAFTQGLLWYEGFFYESTGGYGRSTLRKVDPKTGKVLQNKKLPDNVFGEGLTMREGLLYQLDWKSGRGFIYNRETLEEVKRFRYFGEGWGLAWTGEQFVLSDGTHHLRFLNPQTMKMVRSVKVRNHQGKVDQLNELEFINGKIYANRWHFDEIVIIDPKSGFVEATIDLKELEQPRPSHSEAVLNGIAHDPKSGLLYVTGKGWPRMYGLRLSE
ncbi:MAG: glutaminyl-peptide cyclotransferase [Akkermansiaceae bacterium]|jgi:glutamine cyclotransferase